MSKLKSAINSLGLVILLAGTNAYATCTPNITNTSNSSTSTLTSTTSGDCVENSGTIATTADGALAIASSGDATTITNSGIITTGGSDAHGIDSSGADDVIANTGTISTAGDYSYGIHANSRNEFSITNTGSITTSGYLGIGILSTGPSSTASNSGTITTTGDTAYGIRSYGNNSTIKNSGVITTSGANANGIMSHGDGVSIINSGVIRSTGSGSAAIYLANPVFSASHSTNTTVNLLRGSVIVGDIVADNTVSGAKLNINLGAGASYAYSVTGPWTVTDLDNRPMVTGSAYAAGIGAQETASQMLYQRTSVITSALDRRLRSYASDEVDNQPYWLDVYYADVTRNSGGNYSTQTAFSNYNYGMTAGFKLPVEVTPLELVVNVDQSKLNIDSGNQKVDSTSLMVGVLAPSVTDVLGAKLSVKALLGYADHDGDRKVMTNSLLYDGSRQIKSDYSSLYGVVGTALTRLYPITDRLTADAVLGLDLNVQRTRSYSEQDYFSWDSRTLTQLQSRIQAGLNYSFNENKATLFARVGAENRNLIGGAIQDYQINNTNVSFNTDNKNDTYLTAQLGFKAQLEKRVQLFGVLNTLHSSDSVNSISGNIGLKADF